MSRVVLGLDIGGSRSRGRLCEGGRVVFEAEAGSGNASAVGDERAEREVAALVERLRDGCGGSLELAAVCAGVAGADAAAARSLAAGWLRRALPGVPVRVVHDARLVLAAAGLDEGIALVAGTGSIAWGWAGGGSGGLPADNEARAGGWGHLLGDEGSGYWVVREGIRQVLADHDRGRARSPLAAALLGATGSADPIELLHHFHERRSPSSWAGHASVVLAAAPDLAERAGRELAGLVVTVAGRIGAIRAAVVVAGGMVLNESAVEAALRRELRRQLPSLEVVRLSEPPVAGAVRLAEQMLPR